MVLTAIAIYLLAGLPLRSSVASAVLFAVMLRLLTDAGSTNSRRLYFLPPLFLLWSNLDIQFVYGLITLFLFLIVQVTTSFAERGDVQPHNSHAPLRTAES